MSGSVLAPALLGASAWAARADTSGRMSDFDGIGEKDRLDFGRAAAPWHASVWDDQSSVRPRASAVGAGFVSEIPEHQPLRVLIANQRSDRLDHVTSVVLSLGHEVVARSIEVGEVAAVTGRERPDVALVGLGDSSRHALDLIGEIVRQAACPVITLLETDDHVFINQAAKRGVFAYITDTSPHQLQDSIEIVLRRFAEFHNLEGAFGRRAVIERAKGILMERHSTSEDGAFEMLRTQSRSGNRKLVDIAAAVVDGHRLLPGPQKSRP